VLVKLQVLEQTLPKRNSEQEPEATPANVTLFESDVAECTLFLAREADRAFERAKDFDTGFAPQKLLVAISGGIDSTALLLALHATASHHKFELHAAHLNHNLRGDESLEDERFCRQLCEEFNIPLHATSESAKASEGLGNPSSEEALRLCRYNFLERTAATIGAKFVVTGHNLNDQAETVIFRLVRGTALAGASGMRAWRKFAVHAWLLRPLLGVSRATISQYVLEREHTARTDSSNRDQRYARNYIRQTIITPLLERFPAALKKIESFACAAAVDNDYLGSIAGKNFAALALEKDHWCVDELKPLHQAVLDRLIVLGLRQRAVEVNADLIEEVRKLIDRDNAGEQRGQRFSLNARWDIARQSHYIQWLDKEAIHTVPPEILVPLKIPGISVILPIDRAVSISLVQIEPLLDAGAAGISLDTDLSPFEGELVLRRRQAGDQFQAAGHKNVSSLKKFLHRRKAAELQESMRTEIDRYWTASHCLVLASGREVLWIVGVAVGEKLTLPPGHRPRHSIRFKRLASDSGGFC
jgi:tRNA(Ile)-lysidine synthase